MRGLYMKAKKVIIELGSAPKDCCIIIDGVKQGMVWGVTASVSVEEGPMVKLHRIDENGIDIHDEIEFQGVVYADVPAKNVIDLVKNYR